MRMLDAVRREDKVALVRFAICMMLMALVFEASLFIKGPDRSLLLKEGGIIESLTLLGYLMCAGFVLHAGRLAYLKTHYAFFLLPVVFGLRELDFDKRFTTMGIFKGRFFFSPRVPFAEKAVGAVIVLALLVIAWSVIGKHYRRFFSGLQRLSAVSCGAFMVCVLLAVSKALDGIGRRLNHHLDVRIGENAATQLEAMEEIMELAIPAILLLTFHAYFKTAERRPDGDGVNLSPAAAPATPGKPARHPPKKRA